MEKESPEGMSDDALNSFFGTKEEAELKSKLAEIHQALDQKEIKKGLEIAMTMGHFANEYFSEQALGPYLKRIQKSRRNYCKNIKYDCNGWCRS